MTYIHGRRPAGRHAPLVEIVEALHGAAQALDSSSESVIRAGLDASAHPERLMLDSASVERLDALDTAASTRCAAAIGLPAPVAPQCVHRAGNASVRAVKP
jgi:hypothetical protein